MSRALARQERNALTGYAPGPLRAGTDNELEVISRFRSRHPEYDRLGDIEIATLATTYRDDAREAELTALEDGGVPADWHRRDDIYNAEEGL